MKKAFITFLLLAVVALGGMARQPERGYRGFIDWSSSIRNDDWLFGKTTSFYTGFATTHGYQFNPRLFVGAGLDYEYCSKITSSIAALFAHARTDLKFGAYTPFGEVRLGYNVAHGGGVYFSPAIGYRFNWGRKMGINAALGMTLQGYTAEVYNIDIEPDGWVIMEKIGNHHGCAAFFSFRVGIDF